MGSMTPARYPRLAAIGWALVIASLLTPDIELEGIGAYMLVAAPGMGVTLLFHAQNWTVAGVGAALLAGFAANLSLFVRLPRWGSVLAILASWAPFAAWLLLWSEHRPLSEAFGMLYVYPWMAGIALIHTARILTPPSKRMRGISQKTRSGLLPAPRA